MIDWAQRLFRRTVFKSYRWAKHPRKLKNSPVRRWIALHFLSKTVWKPTQHTLAGGLALGMFCMVHLIPGQMPLAAVLAALFRVNIPIAIMACWISNPFTFVPLIWAQEKIGSAVLPYMPYFMRNGLHGFVAWLLRVFESFPAKIKDMVGEEMLAKGAEFLTSMYLGGILIGLALIPISYAVSWLTWEVFARMNAWRIAKHAAAASA
jgi:uncharacterized protein